MVRDPACPFCDRAADQIVAESEHAVAIRDAYPSSEGHTLILPKSHGERLFDHPRHVQQEVWALVEKICERLQAELAPAGFNVGLNEGAAAGQTVPHAHVHVIPRYGGDVPDPRGGVRWVLPERARYWS
jgi:diadenosine tetraphosphate (Ap4A) HIT family hydrolase